MPKIAQPIRTITGNEAGTYALTLKELSLHIAETECSLRTKAIKGQFPEAYRTNGGNGDWRFPMSGVREYQRTKKVVIPEKKPKEQ